jgi:hypothetical protein
MLITMATKPLGIRKNLGSSELVQEDDLSSSRANKTKPVKKD